MARERDLAVEVVYALADDVIAVTTHVPPGATVADVIEQGGFARLLPGVDLSAAPVGIFGRVVARDTPVRDGDRVEIYRPLVADPKQARRERSTGTVQRGG
jgi:putative ubiquitin-RnfH superfamily antitoxin RatB of RatAB toxin-antitoxin module